MRYIAASFAALTIAGAGTVSAQDAPNYLPSNGSELADLIRDCSTPDCMSYVSGAINGISVYAYLSENPTPFCSGEEVRSNQIRDAIVEVIEDTPRLGRAAPPAAILTAFARNWPCQTSAAEAVASDIDAVDQAEDLITYADLDQVDMDTLIDFVSRKTAAFTMGDINAPLEQTLHIFDDPNCEYCDVLTDELDILVEQGWRILVYPISTVAEESKGYAAIQYAVRDSETGAPEALYRYSDEGIKDITLAMELSQEAGMAMSEILNLLAASNPYQAIDANNQAYQELGATGEPSWILGDRIASGITEASEILRIRDTMASNPPAIEEPQPPVEAPSTNDKPKILLEDQ